MMLLTWLCTVNDLGNCLCVPTGTGQFLTQQEYHKKHGVLRSPDNLPDLTKMTHIKIFKHQYYIVDASNIYKGQ